MADKRPIETVDGLVEDSKKPLWRKIRDMIFAESIEDVRKDVIKNIIGPYIKDFFYDLFTGSVERSIYGSSRGYSVRNGSSRGPVRAKTSYEPYYKQTTAKNDDELFDPVIMDSRVKAERVRDILQARIAEYGEPVSINDLNDCLKRPGKFTDEYYGWDDLSGVVIKKLSLNEYQVIFPEPRQIAKKGRAYSYEI